MGGERDGGPSRSPDEARRIGRRAATELSRKEEAMITQHLLARPLERREAPRLAREITLRSRELARREERERRPALAAPEPAPPRRPARAARALARALGA